ncbi:hypothetical protein cypCar_00029104 [Cyprinus carpio]|nr:hypothetical protein cypCar_00029104 [Cyprinus carpio]
MQEHLQSCVDDRPVNLSEGEIVSLLTEQLDNDVVMSIESTRKYCPPEYLETGKYNGRQATVFSLGVVLYTLVCGYYPDRTDLDKIKDWLWYLPSLSKGHPISHGDKNTLQQPPRNCSLVSLVSGGLTQVAPPSLQSLASCKAGKIW